jgi:hypothetical protein
MDVLGMDNHDHDASSTINNNKNNYNYNESITLELWQQCTVFLAPTLTMNLGVYANIDFKRGDIVDVAGLTIPITIDSPAVERSILHDYVYGYWRLLPPSVPPPPPRQGQKQDQPYRPTVQRMYSVLLGYDMYYNHNATPNIEFQTFGREPQSQHLQSEDVAMNAQGYVALRDISRGEELFSTYKNGNEYDGGIGWFHQRGLALKTLSLEDTQLSPTQVEEYAQQYCSKITATISSWTWQHHVMSLWPPSPRPLVWMKEFPYLPPVKDAGWGQAYAKVYIPAGQRIELSTALLMSYSRHIQGTALRPISYTWHDLFPYQRQVLQQLHDQKQLVVQYQGPDTDWISIIGYSELEDIVLFPAAGNVGMVRKKTSKNQPTNCHFVLHPPPPLINPFDENNNHNSDDDEDHYHHPLTDSVTMELIATKNIKVGDVLVVNVPVQEDDNDDDDDDEEEFVFTSTTSTTTTRKEYELLYRELQQSGQLFEKSIFRNDLPGRWEPSNEL